MRRLVELPPQDNVNILGFVVALALASLASLGLGRLVRSVGDALKWPPFGACMPHGFHWAG